MNFFDGFKDVRPDDLCRYYCRMAEMYRSLEMNRKTGLCMRAVIKYDYFIF